MTQKKIYIEQLASRMRSAGQHKWTFRDIADLCELAGLWGKWYKAANRIEEESLALKAAEILGVEIRHRIA